MGNPDAAEDTQMAFLRANVWERRDKAALTTVDAREMVHPQMKEASVEDLLECELCLVCLGAQKQTTFVHGDTGHSCCCVECAELFKQQGCGTCPLCREHIEKVIRQY
eukprot:TRINITY_DN14546_c0_g1_i8.p3 TRINITY_DN14546_c0_g1~~TRINITY_DN14546_c0_g1_i8.p3  ORF type:complete len:108 (-),score=23.99 TRINITY_DN14546_c0_g1_i8:361-684(-)